MTFKACFIRMFSFRPLIGRGLFCAMLVAVLPAITIFGAERTANTSSCTAIADLATPDFVVEKAEIVPAGPAPMSDGSGAVNDTGELLPEHCLIQGMLNPWSTYEQEMSDQTQSIRRQTNEYANASI